MSANAAVQIHVLAGTDAGKRLLLQEQAISIGRDATNTLVIDLPHVSRQHAELRLEEGKWWLVNHSANGTRLDSRKVTKKPRELTGTHTITIGSDQVLQVTVQLPAQTETAATAPAAPVETDAGNVDPTARSRRKLWTGIGIYVGAVALIGMIIFAVAGGERKNAGPSIPTYDDAQIAAEIRRPIQKQTPNPRRVEEYLREAARSFALRDAEKDALYRAYDAFRNALAYSEADEFASARDQRTFEKVQEDLIKLVASEYLGAQNRLRTGENEDAADRFEEVTRIYPARGTPLFDNVQRKWKLARERSQSR